MVRRFLLGRIPVYVDGALNIVDVRDVAPGHLLADEKGEVGERYILGGRNFTLDRLFADLTRISGVAPPELRLPGPRRRRRGWPSRARVPLRSLPDEVRSASLWWTYRSTKAKQRARVQAASARGDARGGGRLATRAARGPFAARGGAQRLALRATGRLLGGLERVVGG